MLKMNILELNEDILREIFSYIDYSELYFMLRQVCRHFKKHVDNFVELAAVFMFVHSPGNPSILFYTFKKYNHIVSVYYKDGPPLPRPKVALPTSSILKFDVGSFGGNIKGKVIVGVYYTEVIKQLSKRSKVRLMFSAVALQRQQHCYLTEYRADKNKWVPIESTDIKGIYGADCVMYSCSTANSIVALEEVKGRLFNRSRMEMDLEEGALQNNNCVRNFHFNIENKKDFPTYGNTTIQNLIRQITYRYKPISARTNLSPLPFPLNTIKESSIVQIDEDKILFVGGVNYGNTPNMTLWQGKLSTEKNSSTSSSSNIMDGSNTSFAMSWTSLSAQISRPRLMPLCFKLKNNVFIVGGESTNGEEHLCYDRYNTEEMKLYNGSHELPFPINGKHRVVTDAKETFAVIITTDVASEPVIFTEDQGFVIFTAPPLFLRDFCMKLPCYGMNKNAIFLRIK